MVTAAVTSLGHDRLFYSAVSAQWLHGSGCPVKGCLSAAKYRGSDQPSTAIQPPSHPPTSPNQTQPYHPEPSKPPPPSFLITAPWCRRPWTGACVPLSGGIIEVPSCCAKLSGLATPNVRHRIGHSHRIVTGLDGHLTTDDCTPSSIEESQHRLRADMST